MAFLIHVCTYLSVLPHNLSHFLLITTSVNQYSPIILRIYVCKRWNNGQPYKSYWADSPHISDTISRYISISFSSCCSFICLSSCGNLSPPYNTSVNTSLLPILISFYSLHFLDSINFFDHQIVTQMYRHEQSKQVQSQTILLKDLEIRYWGSRILTSSFFLFLSYLFVIILTYEIHLAWASTAVLRPKSMYVFTFYCFHLLQYVQLFPLSNQAFY